MTLFSGYSASIEVFERINLFRGMGHCPLGLNSDVRLLINNIGKTNANELGTFCELL